MSELLSPNSPCLVQRDEEGVVFHVMTVQALVREEDADGEHLSYKVRDSYQNIHVVEASKVLAWPLV